MPNISANFRAKNQGRARVSRAVADVPSATYTSRRLLIYFRRETRRNTGETPALPEPLRQLLALLH